MADADKVKEAIENVYHVDRILAEEDSDVEPPTKYDSEALDSQDQRDPGIQVVE